MTGLEIGLLGVIYVGSCYITYIYGMRRGIHVMKLAFIAQLEEMERRRKIVQLSGHRNNNKGGMN